jgi:hypothetical protein
MSRLAEILRTLIEYSVAALDGLGPLFSLTVLSCVTGALMLWIVGKTTPQTRLERARARLAAAVYEMRLFIDSPGRVIRAQGQLFSWFAWYMALLLPAFVLLSIPLGLFLLHLETRHGLDALPVGEPIIMRVELAPGVSGYDVSAGPVSQEPGADQAVRVTAPPLYIEDENRVYFRLEVDAAHGPGEYAVGIAVKTAAEAGETRVEKRISADPGADAVFPERRSGWAAWYQLGYEPPLPDGGPITAIILEHPDKRQTWLFWGAPWWLYWLLISTIVALALRRPLGVVI